MGGIPTDRNPKDMFKYVICCFIYVPGHNLYESISKKLEDFDYEIKSTILLAVENNDNNDVVCPGGGNTSYGQSYDFYYTKDPADPPVRVEYYDELDGEMIEVADLYTETSVPIQIHYNTKVYKAKALGPARYSGIINARLITKSGINIDGCTWRVSDGREKFSITNPLKSIVRVAQSGLDNKYAPTGLAFLGIALIWFIVRKKK